MDNRQPNHSRQNRSKQRRGYQWLAIAGLGALVLILARPFAALSDNRLLIPATTPGTVQLNDADPATRRSRTARVNWQAIGPETRTIRLNLFDDLDLTAEHIRTDHSVTGGFVWVGRVAGRPETVTLSVQDGVLAGSVELVGAGRVILSRQPGGAEDLYLIREVHARAEEPNGPDTILPPKPVLPPASPDTSAEPCEEDGSTIDVMVLFTTAVRDARGGTDEVEGLINQLIGEMNTANKDSEAPFTWRLAAAREVPYPESGDLSVDLSNLQIPNNGLLDEIHGWRNDVRADLVTMLVTEGSNNICGIAFQMTKPESWFESYAFSVAALDYPGNPTCSQLTMAHELGHNAGNAHDRAHASIAGIFPYSYGYQSLNGTAPFRDIMAYDCPGGCPRINRWANPDVLYLGEPTGVDHETDPEHSADLVRSMDNVRQLVSNFRPYCPTDPDPTNTPSDTTTPAPTATPNPTNTPTPPLPATSTPTPTVAGPTPTATPTATPTPTIIPTTPATANRRYYLPLLVWR